jgi:hypothetical protein
MLVEQTKKSENELFVRHEGALQKNHYFDNELVEHLLYLYHETACTSVKLRDLIMIHADELIRQTIKAHNLSQIYPGKEESSIGDLFQTAWIQIESALYKYNAKPHCNKCYNPLRPGDSVLSDDFMLANDVLKKIRVCPRCKVVLIPENIHYRGNSKVFNMWSQISRTVILAYIKKESRDRKNSPMFTTHLENKTVAKSHVLDRFVTEARELCKYNPEYMSIIEAIEKLYDQDERPHEGLVAKLSEKTGLQRIVISDFLRLLRQRSFEFTDSPVNEEFETIKHRMTSSDDKENDHE